MDSIHKCLYSPRMGLGENVKHLRIARKLTYEEVGAAVGTDGQNIFNLEKRKSKVSKFAPALAKYFGVDLDVLTSSDLTTLSQEEVRQLGLKLRAVEPPTSPRQQNEGLKKFAELAAIFARIDLEDQNKIMVLARGLDKRQVDALNGRNATDDKT